jgi:hypothetical protein
VKDDEQTVFHETVQVSLCSCFQDEQMWFFAKVVDTTDKKAVPGTNPYYIPYKLVENDEVLSGLCSRGVIPL